MFFKIDHVNLTVSNLAESLHWYGDVFGFKKVESGKSEDGSPWAIIENSDFMLCLYQAEKLQPMLDNKEEKYHRIEHFGFRIMDRDGFEKLILEKNLKVKYGGVVPYQNSLSWYVVDPSGYEIEVSYLLPGRKLFTTSIQ